MTKRQEQVNSVLQRQISEYLITDKPEGITGLVTITQVDVTEDLEHAKIYFSSIGQEPEAVLEILRRNIYDIQGALYKHLEMRKVPRIAFVADHSGEYAGRIGKVIRDLHQDGDNDSPDA